MFLRPTDGKAHVNVRGLRGNVPQPRPQGLMLRIELEHTVVLVGDGGDEQLMDIGGRHAVGVV